MVNKPSKGPCLLQMTLYQRRQAVNNKHKKQVLQCVDGSKHCGREWRTGQGSAFRLGRDCIVNWEVRVELSSDIWAKTWRGCESEPLGALQEQCSQQRGNSQHKGSKSLLVSNLGFSTHANFSPRGHMAMPGDTSVCPYWDKGWNTTGMSWLEARDSTKCPTRHRMGQPLTAKNDFGPKWQ